MSQQALWSGRFAGGMAESTLDFTTSLETDSALAFFDVMGSLAHVRMLKKCQIIPEDDADRIIEGLKTIVAEMENGEFKLDFSLEDIHTNVEFRLTELIGPAGGKLHTGRSRNDQVALDIRLYLRSACDEVRALVQSLMDTLLSLAEEHVDTIMPGYTHMQKAQPITFAHHLMAYFEMLKRDEERLSECRKRINVMPLGSGALAGTTYPLDREYVAEQLGFDAVTNNSLDGVSDRDFAIEFCSDLSMLMMHLSRFCEELILWSSHEFSFVEMDDAYSTGSSIMPQKKNPDVAELIRGKTGRVFGDLTTLLTMMKGLPLAYNKDMQEDKEAVFDALDTVLLCLPVFTNMVKTMNVRKDVMLMGAKGGFANATDVADYLVKKGVPFRDSHSIVGQMVAKAISLSKNLDDFTLEEFKECSPLIEDDIYEAISMQTCVGDRKVKGGPAPERVRQEIADGRAYMRARK